MKYVITEKQYRALTEIGRESGHFPHEPLDNFYTFMHDKLSNKEKKKYFYDFFSNKLGFKVNYNDPDYEVDVTDYFYFTQDSDWGKEFKTKDARSGFAYYVAKKHFGLKKGIELQYVIEKNYEGVTYYFFDSQLKIYVGRMFLYETSKPKNSFKVGMSSADEELVGTGYGTKMYLTVLQNCRYLFSDETLYAGSYRMWKHVLPKYVNVWGVVEGSDGEIIDYKLITPSKNVSVRKYNYFVGSAKYDTIK